MDYPKVYKPATRQKVIFGLMSVFTIGPIGFMLFSDPTLSATAFDPQILKVMIALTIFALIAAMGFDTLGYSVTLIPNSIEITTFLGSKIVNKNDIKSYEVGLGKTVCIYLMTISSNRAITVPLSFMRDEGFNEWFKPIPSTKLSLASYDAKLIRKGEPLPKIIGVLVSFVVAALGAVILMVAIYAYQTPNFEQAHIFGIVILLVSLGVSALAVSVWNSTFDEDAGEQTFDSISSSGRVDSRWVYIAILVAINLQTAVYANQWIHKQFSSQTSFVQAYKP